LRLPSGPVPGWTHSLFPAALSSTRRSPPQDMGCKDGEDSFKRQP